MWGCDLEEKWSKFMSSVLFQFNMCMSLFYVTFVHVPCALTVSAQYNNDIL